MVILVILLLSKREESNFRDVALGNSLSLRVSTLLSRSDSTGDANSFLYENVNENLFLKAWSVAGDSGLPLQKIYRKLADEFISNAGQGVLVNYGPMGSAGPEAITGEIRTSGSQDCYYYLTVVRADGLCYVLVAGTIETLRGKHSEAIRVMTREFQEPNEAPVN